MTHPVLSTVKFISCDVDSIVLYHFFHERVVHVLSYLAIHREN